MDFHTFSSNFVFAFLRVTRANKDLKSLSAEDKQSCHGAKDGEAYFLPKKAIKPILLEKVPDGMKVL